MKSTLSRIVSIVAALCLFSVATALQAQNPSNPLDVNGDTSISPFDAVTVFNDLITNGSHSTPPSFHDVNGDGFVTPIDSLRPINYLNANGITPAFPGGGGPVNITAPAHAAHISLVVTDTGGTPISSVSVGQIFQLEVFAQDTRPSPDGVFAAYTDLTYSDSNASLVPSSYFDGPGFVSANVPNTSTSGLVANAGAYMTSLVPPGGAQQFVFALQFVAQAQGLATFSAGPSALAPITDTLLYDLDVAVPTGQIDFSGASLTIVPEPSSIVLGLMGCMALWISRRFFRRG